MGPFNHGWYSLLDDDHEIRIPIGDDGLVIDDAIVGQPGKDGEDPFLASGSTGGQFIGNQVSHGSLEEDAPD